MTAEPQRHVTLVRVGPDGTPTDAGQAQLDAWAKDGWEVESLTQSSLADMVAAHLVRPAPEPRFNPPAHRIRRFGEPTHTTTYAFADAPCGARVKVYNDAYERPVETECEGHPAGIPHRWAIVIHDDAAGISVVFFARLLDKVG